MCENKFGTDMFFFAYVHIELIMYLYVFSMFILTEYSKVQS